MNQHYQSPVYWDNIEGAPYLIKGPSPTYNLKTNSHVIELSASDAVYLRIPPHSILRLVPIDSDFTHADVAVSYSNGSGLYVDCPPSSHSTQESWFYVPNLHETGIVKIKHNEIEVTKFRFAVFVSRQEFAREIESYPFDLSSNTKRVEIRQSEEWDIEQFYVLEPNNPISINVGTNIWMELETYLPYSQDMDKRDQAYAVQVHGGKDGHSQFEFSTTPNSLTHFKVNGTSQIMGYRRNVYFANTKHNKTIYISSDRRLYFRLKGVQESNYLLSVFNRNHPSVATLVDHVQKASLKFQDDSLLDNVKRFLFSPIIAEELPQLYTLSERFLQSNEHPEGALTVASLLEKAASDLPDASQLREDAESTENRYTFYRELSPKSENEALKYFSSYFIPSTLAPIDSDNPQAIFSENRLTEQVQQTPYNHFVQLTADKETPFVYNVPSRPVPSKLRVAVINNKRTLSPKKLGIQFDDLPYKYIELDSKPNLPLSNYAISPLAESFALLEYYRNNFIGLTASAGFTQKNPPASLNRVAYAEFDLPASIEKIKIWNASKPYSDPFISLAYRSSRTFQLSETKYLERLEVVSKQFLTKLIQVNPFEQNTIRKTKVEEEIHQHWVPFLRYLEKYTLRLKNSVSPLNLNLQKSKRLSQAETQRIIQEAKRLEQKGMLIESLELWNNILYNGHSTGRSEALMNRSRLLLALHEFYLAEQQYLGIWLYEDDNEIRRKAFDQLASYYINENEYSKLVQLYAKAVKEQPNAKYFRLLAEALKMEGHNDYALLSALTSSKLNPEAMPKFLLYELAIDEEWFSIIDPGYDFLGIPKKDAYWLSRISIQRGNIEEAKQWLQDFETQNVELLQNINSQQIVADKLTSPDLTIRKEGINEWRDIQLHASSNTKHTNRWFDATYLIRQAQAEERIHITDLDVYLRGYISRKESPVILEVEGPGLFKFDVRPLFAQISKSLINDWAIIETETDVYPYPITNNMPNSSMKAIVHAEKRIGRREECIFQVGEGRHQIKIYALKNDLFIQAYQYSRPIEMGILPRLAPITIQSARQGRFMASHSPYKQNNITNVTLLSPSKNNDNDQHSAKYVHLATRPLPMSAINTDEINQDKTTRGLDSLTTEILGVAPETLLQRTSVDPKNVLDFMKTLLWLAEHCPEWRFEAQLLGEHIYHQFSHMPQMQSIHARITEDLSWERITAVAQSAGLRSEEYKGWKTESPNLRIRKNLLPPIRPEQEVLYSDKRLGIAFTNFQKSTIRIDFDMQVPDFLPNHPITVSYQLNDGEVYTIKLLKPNAPETAYITIPSGEHIVRCWIQNPVVNHFVFVTFMENVQNAGETSSPSEYTPLVPKRQRFYHVAQANQSIALPIQGPAWLRIDEYDNGAVISQYRYLEKGSQKLEIVPSGNRESGLFRIYERVPRMGENKSELRQNEYPSLSLPDPSIEIENLPSAEDPTRWFENAMGGNEDGTWSFGMKAQRRRIIEEDVLRSREFDDFLQWTASHRYHHELWDTFFHTDLINRFRSPGGPTYGLTEDIRYSPNWFPWTFHFGGDIYVQDMDDQNLASKEDMEFSARLQTAVSNTYELYPRWRTNPRLSLFARHLSLNQNSAFGVDHLDQDVYTRYKQEHQTGMRLSNTLRFNPWQDTEWWMLGGVASNELGETFQPDNLYFKTGWKQRFGQSQMDLTFHLYHFLNDADRRTSSTRKAMSMNFFHDIWLNQSHRLELGGTARYDLDYEDFTARVFLTWHFGRGRIYKDFQPGELDFMPIRDRFSPAFYQERR